MESRVPVCVYDLIGLFAFGCRYKRLKAELDVCDVVWQRTAFESVLEVISLLVSLANTSKTSLTEKLADFEETELFAAQDT